MGSNLRVRLVAISAIALLFLPAIALAAPAGDLQGLSGHLDVAMAKVESGDVAGSQAEYDAFAQDWLGIENGVRQQSLDQYQQIESHMTDVTAAYAVQPSEATRIDSALKSLDASVDQFISQFGSSSAGPATAANPATSVQPSVTVASELQTLQQAQAQITSHDATGAANDVKSFIAGWPEIEGPVAAKDANSYTRIENEMDQAYGLLTSTPPNTTQASAVIDDMQSRLTPFSQQVRYGMFDAAIILLREGFEALLVFAALLTFLKRSGNAARQGWVWAGGGAGLGLSVVIAIIVNLAFAKAGGSSRELLEGVTGLVAAVMLIWMMFWLHGKANVAAWNRYISERSQRALATKTLDHTLGGVGIFSLHPGSITNFSLDQIGYLARDLRGGANGARAAAGSCPAYRAEDEATCP